MGNKTTKIIDIDGKEHEVQCIACSIQNGDIRLPVERITETENFVVEQDLEWPIEGLLVIVSKKHVYSIEELSDQEVNEFSQLLKKVRKLLKEVLGISHITLVQEENIITSHFHLWLFPWHSWMLKRWNGKLHEIKDIMKYAKQEFSDKESLEKIRQSAIKLRQEI